MRRPAPRLSSPCTVAGYQRPKGKRQQKHAFARHGFQNPHVSHLATQSIALWQPPTLPTRSRSLRSYFANAPPQTKSCRTSTWHAIQLLFAWFFRLPLARGRESLGPKANTSPIICDSGACISIISDLSDFVGPVTSQGTITQLKGIAKGLQIKGQGEVTWAVQDQLSNLPLLKIPAFHVPNIKVRLLLTSMTSSLLQTYPDETITIEPTQLTLSGMANDVN